MLVSFCNPNPFAVIQLFRVQVIPALRVALHKATARFNGRPAKNMQLENAQRFTQHVNMEIRHSKKVGKTPMMYC